MKKNYMFLVNQSQAAEVARSLNNEGFATSLSYLPLMRKGPSAIQKEVQEYETLLQRIHTTPLNSDVTVKVQQFGFFTDIHACEKAITAVTAAAERYGIRVWLDMERPSTVDATLEMFERISKNHNNIGICLQAYLRRTDADLTRMMKTERPIRLVKGFYKQTDYPVWLDVQKHYAKLMKQMLDEATYPCIATHDPILLHEAKSYAKKRKGPFEFQRFIGVRESEGQELVKQGFPTRVYIPYGNIPMFLLHGGSSFDNKRHIQRLFKREVIV
jgi:proline dehydrogenase